MRRKDKETTDPALVAQVLDAVEYGVLGLVSPLGRAVLVPLNFVPLDGHLYFHGATAGEKMEILAQNPEATFLVVDACAQIPSYAFDPVRACPASQYYRSVIFYGRVGQVEDPDRKARVLEAIMAKVQPEGGYRPITAGDPLYTESVKHVAILEFRVERSTAKVALGQNLSAEKREAVVELLSRRGGPADARTLAAMGGDPGLPSPS